MNPLKMTHVSAMTQSSPERRSKTDAISGPRPGVSDVENVEASPRRTSKPPAKNCDFGRGVKKGGPK